MRIGHPTPLPNLEHPARGIAFIAAGTVVLCAVQGWGAILIGCGLISYGVCVLVISPTPQKAPRHANGLVAPQGARRKRITHERERHTRERIRIPPAAS